MHRPEAKENHFGGIFNVALLLFKNNKKNPLTFNNDLCLVICAHDFPTAYILKAIQNVTFD